MSWVTVVTALTLMIAIAAIVVGSVSLSNKNSTTGKQGPPGENGANGAPGPAGPTDIQVAYFAATVSIPDSYLLANGNITFPATPTTPTAANEWVSTAATNRLVLQWSLSVAGNLAISVWIDDVQLQHTATMTLTGMYTFDPPVTIAVGSVIKVSATTTAGAQVIANLQMFVY